MSPEDQSQELEGDQEKRTVEEDPQPVEVVPVDDEEHTGEAYLLEEESALDYAAQNAAAEETARRSTRHTEDDDIEDTFEEAQEKGAGRHALRDRLESHHATSPDLSAGDVDAAWEAGQGTGEETVGGTAPTPDQDMVEELGKAVGLTYEDDEPLGGDRKLRQRDEERWELDPESAEDEER